MKKLIILSFLCLSLLSATERNSIASGHIPSETLNLFLRTYQESVDAAKSQPLAIDTPLNRRSLELFRARENFRAIASQQNIPKDTIQTLVNFLNFDIIENYLKGFYSQKIAYQLLLEQSSPTNMSLEDFFKLSVDFYTKTLGVDLRGQNAEKIKELAVYIQTVNGFVDEVIGMTDDQLELLGDPNNWKNSDEFFEKLTTKLYLLLYRDNVKEKRSDESKSVVKKLVDRFNLNLNYTSMGELFDMKLVNLIPGVEGKKVFVEMLKTLETEEIQSAKIKIVHGANSSILVGLAQTGAMLIPTGMLSAVGISPLSGELADGATKFGVNRENISGYPLSRFKSSWNNYAFYQAETKTETLEDYISKREKYTKIDGRDYSLQEIKDLLTFKVYKPAMPSSDYYALSPSGAISLYNNNQKEIIAIRRIEFNLQNMSVSRMPHVIKQLRQLDPESFESLKGKLLATLILELEMLDAYKNTDAMVANPNIEHTYKNYRSNIKRSINAINAPIHQLTDEEKEIINHSFPIVFASSIKWQQELVNGEYKHSGPLALGDGISHVIVKPENVEFMQGWLKKHVIRESLPQVLNLDEFYNQYPEAKG